MKNLKFKISKKLIILIAVILLSPCTSSAAEIFFETAKKNFAVNQSFTVDVFIDTEGQSINAVEGSIGIDPEFLRVLEIIDGNTLLNFWIEKPRLEDDKIVFSGITPGGLRGDKMPLFSLILQTEKPGDFSLKSENIKTLLNDGNGTLAVSKTKELALKADPNLQIEANDFIDGTPPEPFQITISSDPNLYDGKYFAVFAAQDKGSGVKGYKLKEGYFGGYKEAESPHVLSNQSPKTRIAVVAYDKFGNERKTVLNATTFKWNMLVILVIILLLAYCIRKARWKRKNQ